MPAAKAEKETKFDMRKIEQLAGRIRRLEVQAATSIAVQSLVALRPLVEKKGFGKEFEVAADMLIRTRPTGISLYNALQYLKKERTLAALDRLLSYNRDSFKRIAKYGQGIVERGARILTHCHSTTVNAILAEAKPKGIHVYVTETRPVLQGLITARELLAADIPVTYCVDSAIGYILQNHDIDMVIVGADAVKSSGVINKLGTYPIAAIANDIDIPFYVATNLLKFDFHDRSTIELRAPREVISPTELPRAEVINPAFDLTPWKYIAGVVTERGILTRSEALKVLRQGFSIEMEA